jgi:peroxiredoxin
MKRRGTGNAVAEGEKKRAKAEEQHTQIIMPPPEILIHRENILALPKVQKLAPDFSATALMPDKTFSEISLSQFRGKYVVLLFYPLDFTFVCPTEIIAFGDRADEFAAINTQVIAASCDSKFTVSTSLDCIHLAAMITNRALSASCMGQHSPQSRRSR